MAPVTKGSAMERAKVEAIAPACLRKYENLGGTVRRSITDS